MNWSKGKKGIMRSLEEGGAAVIRTATASIWASQGAEILSSWADDGGWEKG